MSSVERRCGINRAVRALRNSTGLSLAAVALLALTISVPAFASNLVTNGGFEMTTNGPNYFIGQGVSELVGWNYNPWPNPNAAVYTFAAANGIGAYDAALGAYIPLYGPGNGFNNGFVPSPDGGNFLGSDGEASYQGAIGQTINGLTPGGQYVVSFVWAGNQYLDGSSLGYNGPLTADWQVSLGAQTFTTPVANYSGHGFTGWMTQSFTFTASSGSEVLSFLAQGTPNGLPPVALLDGVSFTPTPEPASLTLVATGLMGLAGFAARFKKRS